MPEVSIIVRTKNEENWIQHCLNMIFKQKYKDFEVIIVDNESNDHTVQIAKRFKIASVIFIEHFLPGCALNLGIRASGGKYIVCISAHCVPKDEFWLDNLIRNFHDDEIAGVYGRQLPVAFTDDADKRDLLTTFGLDRRVQVKDYFFHNANSMLRRDVWEKFPFDEKATNVEDRIWGKLITDAGYKIIYDPDAVVYHHHGLHQGNEPKRARGVVSIIEKVDRESANNLPSSLYPDQINVAAVIPVKKMVLFESTEEMLIKEVISLLKDSKYVNSIYIMSPNENLSKELEVNWIDRRNIRNADQLSINDLLRNALDKIEITQNYPESILYVNYEYGFRKKGFFDNLITTSQFNGYDTVFPGYLDFGNYWYKDSSDKFIQIDSSLELRENKDPIYRALYGLGCVTSTWLIRSGKLVGGQIGILPVTDIKNTIKIKEIGSELIFQAIGKSRENEKI